MQDIDVVSPFLTLISNDDKKFYLPGEFTSVFKDVTALNFNETGEVIELFATVLRTNQPIILLLRKSPEIVLRLIDVIERNCVNCNSLITSCLVSVCSNLTVIEFDLLKRMYIYFNNGSFSDSFDLQLCQKTLIKRILNGEVSCEGLKGFEKEDILKEMIRDCLIYACNIKDYSSLGRILYYVDYPTKPDFIQGKKLFVNPLSKDFRDLITLVVKGGGTNSFNLFVASLLGETTNEVYTTFMRNVPKIDRPFEHP